MPHATYNTIASVPITITVPLPDEVQAGDVTITASPELEMVVGPGPEGIYGGGYTLPVVSSTVSGTLTVTVAKRNFTATIDVVRHVPTGGDEDANFFRINEIIVKVE